jgi:hypothetical protein
LLEWKRSERGANPCCSRLLPYPARALSPARSYYWFGPLVTFALTSPCILLLPHTVCYRVRTCTGHLVDKLSDHPSPSRRSTSKTHKQPLNNLQIRDRTSQNDSLPSRPNVIIPASSDDIYRTHCSSLRSIHWSDLCCLVQLL